jgi:ketosteroid isomerase-like protein
MPSLAPIGKGSWLMRQFPGIAIVALLLLAGGGSSTAQTTGDTGAVRAANRSYYEALSARDIRTMEQIWTQSPDDVNVAPPIRPAAHVGWTELKKNYEAFWGTLDELIVSMDNPAIKVEGNVAWVYGTEQAKRRTKDGQVSGGPNFGTSIFVKRNGRWLMVFHQAALMPQQPPQGAK